MTAYKINENHVFLCLNQKEDKKLSTKRSEEHTSELQSH